MAKASNAEAQQTEWKVELMSPEKFGSRKVFKDERSDF